jgi:hypothetical protein
VRGLGRRGCEEGLSLTEAGRHKLQDDQAKLIDKNFGLGRLFEMLLWYARMAHDPEWGKQYDRYERLAELIRIYDGQVVPLVLQTDDCTWAYVQTADDRDFEAVKARRMERKRSLLNEKDSPELWVVVDEAALARQVGDPQVMLAQYEHLYELSLKPEVTFRVVPFTAGAHAGTEGPFSLINLDSRDIAYASAQNGGRLIETPGEIRDLGVRFERISAKAASEDASREILTRYMERTS